MVERHPGHESWLAEGLRELRLGDQAGLDEELTELPAVTAALDRERLLELRLGDDLRLDEQLADCALPQAAS